MELDGAERALLVAQGEGQPDLHRNRGCARSSHPLFGPGGAEVEDQNEAPDGGDSRPGRDVYRFLVLDRHLNRAKLRFMGCLRVSKAAIKQTNDACRDQDGLQRPLPDVLLAGTCDAVDAVSPLELDRLVRRLAEIDRVVDTYLSDRAQMEVIGPVELRQLLDTLDHFHQGDKPLLFRVALEGIKDDLLNAGAQWVDEPAFRSQNIVWGRVVPDIPFFCRELVAALAEQKAKE